MKLFTYTQARQRLSEVLDAARDDKVLIRRRNGETFVISQQQPKRSPLDVPGIRCGATTKDIVEAVRESRRAGT